MGVFNKLKDMIGIEEIEDEEITEEEIEVEKAKLVQAPAQQTPQRPQLQSRTFANTSANPFKLVVVEPKGVEECSKLVDSLRSRKPVIINLEKVESDAARKIFDFMNGATYALNGTVQKVANNIFIFAPENVDIASKLDHDGIDFGKAPKGGSAAGMFRK